MNEWVERQVASLRALSGCTVVRWHGNEMALRETGVDGLPDWRDVSVPFLQLGRLDLMLADGWVASVITYQNVDRWGCTATTRCRRYDWELTSQAVSSGRACWMSYPRARFGACP